MTAHLSMEQRRLARRLHAKGLSLREIGRQVGCSHEVVRTVVRRASKRPVRSEPWQPGPGRLTLADREEISLGVRAGDSFTAIALRLGKAVSRSPGRWPAAAAEATTGLGVRTSGLESGLVVPSRRS
jgi:IS30 family transposase